MCFYGLEPYHQKPILCFLSSRYPLKKFFKQRQSPPCHHYFPGKETPSQYSLHFDDQEFSTYTQLKYAQFDTGYCIVGSCNGLLCFWDIQSRFDGKFILCNPSIGKSITLPKPCFCSPSRICTAGFGFDSIRNDDRILKISKKKFWGKIEVELNSLNRNSWEKLAPPKYDLYNRDSMVFVNGVVHWIACERMNDQGR